MLRLRSTLVFFLGLIPFFGSGTAEATNWLSSGTFNYNTDNVGIGVTTPSASAPPYKLEVKGGPVFMQYARFDNGGSLWEIGSDASSDGFYIYKNGVDYKLVVNNSGNVGIGTKSAKAGLHINSVGTTINGTQTDRGFLLLGPSAGLQMQFDADEIQAMSNNAVAPLNLNFSGGNTLMNVKGGAVGIGTATPASPYKLDVRGGGMFAPFAQFNNGGSLWEVGTDITADGFYIYKNGFDYKLVVNNSGNVGIGTKAAKAGLHINNVGNAVSGTQADRGFLLVGPSAGAQIQVDNDEIQAMNNNAPANLYLNHGGGNTILNIIGGAVGIGTAAPLAPLKLDIRGGGMFAPYVKVDNGGSLWEIGTDVVADGFYIYKGNGGGYKMVVDNSGNVGIGVNRPTQKLDVAGSIKAVSVVTSSWSIAPPDYVFEDGYKPMSLENVEKFTRKHRHLPEIPSAKEMKSKGLDLAEMNLRLLKKVEELTLHAIDQEKRIAAQDKRLKAIEAGRR